MEPKDKLPRLMQWTRSGIIDLQWGPYDNFDSLAFAPTVKDHLCRMAMGLTGAKSACERLQISWRHGCMLYGTPGSGKSAASRAVSLLLGWNHLIINDRDILDAHLMTRALSEVARHQNLVVTIENIDQILTRVDSKDFINIFDDVSSKASGVFWFATTRRPDEIPKNLLVRPGRFDDFIRLTAPNREVREQYFKTFVQPVVSAGNDEVDVLDRDRILSILESSEGLSYAHLHEMRQLVASLIVKGNTDNLLGDVLAYCQDQSINSDRWGGESQVNDDLRQRVLMSDPRTLLSALMITDVFKKIIEAAVSVDDDSALAHDA